MERYGGGRMSVGKKEHWVLPLWRRGKKIKVAGKAERKKVDSVIGGRVKIHHRKRETYLRILLGKRCRETHQE